MLLEPTERYNKYHSFRKGRFNNTKFCFNSDIFMLSRNAHYSHDARVDHILFFLKAYSKLGGKKLAEKLVSYWENFPIDEFNRININTSL
jgi:hypothetical protein